MKKQGFNSQKWIASLTLATMVLGSLSPLASVSAASVVEGHDITVTASTPTDNGSGGFYVTLDGTAGGPGDGQQIFVRVNWGDGSPTDESFIPPSYTPLGFIEANVDAWFHGIPYGTEYDFSLNGFDSGDWIGQHIYDANTACVVSGTCTVNAELYLCKTPHGGVTQKCADGPEDETELLAYAETVIPFGDEPPPPPPPVDATINLEKVWVLNEGSEAPSFSVLFEGGATLPDSDETPLTRTLTRPAGTYSLTEDAIEGFTTDIVCTRNEEVGNIYANGGVSVSSGDVVNCTITNDENDPAPVPATLTVEKVWQGEPTEYQVNLTGDTFDGEEQVLPSDDETPDTETILLNAGSYTLSEPAIEGYTTEISCSYGEESSPFGNSSNGTYELSLEEGENVTCTVTNTEQTSTEPTHGTLTVIKHVINNGDGELTASDFTLYVSSTQETLPWFRGNASGTEISVPPGQYEVIESEYQYDSESLHGYTVSYGEGCSGSIEAGQEVTCVVTNDDPGEPTYGTVIVTKHVVNDNKGQADANDFLMVVSGTNVSEASFPGSEDGVIVTMDPGEYSIDEDSSGSYSKSLGENCSGTIAAGEVKECVITNDDPGTPGGGGGGGSSGGGGGSSSGGGGGGGGGLPASSGGQVTSFGTPSGRVLGIEDVNTAEGACWADEPEAHIVVKALDEVLNALGIGRDLPTEKFFDTTLVPRVVPTDLAAEFRDMIKNWTAYGTSIGLRLGAGERAGVVDSYRAVYGHVPRTECEWRDALRIASGKLPSLNQEREDQMLATFKTIYGRDADRTQPKDNAAINIMTYGIRPIIRSLANERRAIPIFRRIFGHNPANATEWDIMRAIANSGLQMP